MQYQQPSDSQAKSRFERGRRVVERAAELLGQPLGAHDALYIKRSSNRRDAWEVGAVLFSSRGGDVEAAAARLAEGIQSGQLEDLTHDVGQRSLDGYELAPLRR